MENNNSGLGMTGNLHMELYVCGFYDISTSCILNADQKPYHHRLAPDPKRKEIVSEAKKKKKKKPTKKKTKPKQRKKNR
ncbi:hypothetical protein ACR2WA_25555 [Klebsiella pneumoniae]